MKIFNKSKFKISLCAALLGVTTIACSAKDPAPASTASPPPVSASTPVAEGSPVAMTTEDVSEGEGDALDNAGAVSVGLKIWDDKFEGKPFGRGEMDMMVLPDASQLKGLWTAIQGMKNKGVRRVKISAQELFGEIPKSAHISPNKTFYIQVTVKDVYAKEPFEIKTTKEGKGEVVTKVGDTVKMHYVGHLDNKDGKVFDSSRERGQPFQVELGAGQVIQGWERGLLGMKEGEHRTLSIPHYLAYGDNAKGPIIKPKSRLFFEVEFVGFVKPGKLIMKTTKEGKGEAIAAGQTGKFHYTGWLDGFNGKDSFDSSKKPGRKPFQVKLGAGQVIKGWDEGLVGMKPGEIRQLEIPYNLAYGPKGRSGIPPYATLYFEVEYLGLGE